MSKVVCAIQPCRALERSEREMRLERGKRGAEEKKAVAKQPSHPGSAAAPPREVPTVCAPPLRTHVTHDDQRLGFVERPYGHRAAALRAARRLGRFPKTRVWLAGAKQ